MLAKRIYRHTMWGPQLVKVENALCEDGVRRTATVTAEPDTFFSQPARVSAHGKTVSGFIVCESDGDVKFIAYKYRKNHRYVGG